MSFDLIFANLDLSMLRVPTYVVMACASVCCFMLGRSSGLIMRMHPKKRSNNAALPAAHKDLS